MILCLCTCRIADYVEEIHSESANRLQLQFGEESRNETFPSDAIVFSEVKATRLYLLQNGIKYSLSSMDQGLT